MCRFPIQTNLRALIIALLVAAVAFFCNAAIRAFDATSPYPTIQGPDGTLYAVVPDYATNYDSPDDFSHETRRASSGLFSAFFSNRDDLLEWETLYRGQTPSLIPPVESTSSNSTIGSSSVSNATSNVVAPPAVGSDSPFEPTPVVPEGEPTTFQKIFKYRQEISGSYMFLPASNSKGLGMNELEARLLFAIPCKTMQSVNNMNNGYFLLTPNFVYDNLAIRPGAPSQKRTENVFDAGLTTTFLANYNDLEAHVDFSIGVASIFKKINGEAIYFRGRAELGLPIDNEKQVKLFGGVQYLDRIRYKLVPIVGVTYNPNPQNRLRLAFPNPRWDHYLTKVNETDWWLFVHGDIDGNSWLMYDSETTVRGKNTFRVDYNDYKVGVGVSFDCPTRLRGSFEVGGSFGREMRTKNGSIYEPKSAVYLKFGLLY